MAKHRAPDVPRERWSVGKILLFAAIAGVAVFGFSASWIDSLDEQWVRCEVTAANAVQGNNRSSTPWRTEIQTADCGKITYLGAFTQESSQQLASEMLPGTVYEFKLGGLSRLALGQPFALSTPSAKELRAAAPTADEESGAQ